MQPQVLTVGSVPVHALNMRKAVETIDEFIRSGRPHYNVAINAAKVVEFQRDERMRQSICSAHLLTADGQSIVWASRLLGEKLPERVTGVDLMYALLEHAASRGYSVYLLGATETVVRTCTSKIQARFPQLRVAGFRNGYFSKADQDAIVADIRMIRPDILFLGFGSPAKEYFMHAHFEGLGVPFVMGVGGAFDVLAGEVRRAPRVIQRAGLEWAYRVAQEPSRMWKRYLLGNTRFLLLLARDLLARYGQ